MELFTDNKFSFTLQWEIESEERLVAGQMLGNKKSEFVIVAVSEYIRAHLKVAARESTVSITIWPTQTNAHLMEMVKGMATAAVEELMRV